jgi:hypothetical protein
MIIHAKEQFYLNANGLLDENSNNPKAFWSLVKKVMGNCRSTVIPPLYQFEVILVYLSHRHHLCHQHLKKTVFVEVSLVDLYYLLLKI